MSQLDPQSLTAIRMLQSLIINIESGRVRYHGATGYIDPQGGAILSLALSGLPEMPGQFRVCPGCSGQGLLDAMDHRFSQRRCSLCNGTGKVSP